MKLSLNPKDYRRLLLTLYLGEWMLNSHDAEPGTPLGRKCLESIERFLGYAVQGGCADLVDEIEPGRLVFSEAVHEEPGVAEAIENYDDRSFWRDLVERLAERDFEQIHGRPPAVENAADEPDGPDLPAVMEGDGEADRAELERLEARYWDEFEKNGVRHLHVLKVGRPS